MWRAWEGLRIQGPLVKCFMKFRLVLSPTPKCSLSDEATRPCRLSREKRRDEGHVASLTQSVKQARTRSEHSFERPAVLCSRE